METIYYPFEKVVCECQAGSESHLLARRRTEHPCKEFGCVDALMRALALDYHKEMIIVTLSAEYNALDS